MTLLENKVALVTSSTRGIGLACAKKLAENGAKVYLAVRNLEAGRKVADEIVAAGGKADVVYFDASKNETFASMIDETVAKEGRLDILVNNFGSTDVKADFDVVNTKAEDFLHIVETIDGRHGCAAVSFSFCKKSLTNDIPSAMISM